MHFSFVAYGERGEVERLFRDMEAQKMTMKCWKKGKKDKSIWINGQVRLLPFGVIEYIFPREFKDIVLNTMLGNTAPNRYGLHQLFMIPFRKALKLKAIPKDYKKKEKFLWSIQHVSIAPLGIREDWDIKEQKHGELLGYDHEAI